MRIGSAIFLIAIGAILAWAITPGLIPNVDQTLIGYILMAVGVIGLIASLVLASPGRSRRISETRSVVDPNTGERITRNESRDGGLQRRTGEQRGTGGCAAAKPQQTPDCRARPPSPVRHFGFMWFFIDKPT